MKNGCPVIGLNDSGGARIQEGVASLAGYGDIFHANVQASGVVPQISVIMGPSAGGAVYSPAVTDFIIMVDQTSYMFITGPGVVKSVTAEEISFDDLGGAKTHTQKSGVAHFRATSEEQALAIVRKLLEYIPQNNMEVPPQQESKEPSYTTEYLRNLLPPSANEAYDVKDVIVSIIDKDSFFEVHKDFAENIVVGFGFLGGKSIGIVANQPAHMAGCRCPRVYARIRSRASWYNSARCEITICILRGYSSQTDNYSKKRLWWCIRRYGISTFRSRSCLCLAY
jgi:propionyl-CoA carboxylase beta chain